MRHVDALSRNALPSGMYMGGSAESATARIHAAQQKDAKLRNIVDLVRQNKTSDFRIQGDILLKVNGEDTLIVVPKQMQSSITRHVHKQGHFAARRKYY